jgi:outer membrane protein
MLPKPVRVLAVPLLAAGCAASGLGSPDIPAQRLDPPALKTTTDLDPPRATAANSLVTTTNEPAAGSSAPTSNGVQQVASFTASFAASPPQSAQSDTGRPQAAQPDTGRPQAAQPDTGRPQAAQPDTGRPHAAPVAKSPPQSQQAAESDRQQIGQVTLPEAIQIAYQTQPRLRVYLEGIQEAQGNEQIAFSPYLPTLAGSISGGGFDLNVQGQVANGFSFLPIGGAVPIGLNLETGYGMGDVKLQWLICDFGRRAGHYCQAKLGVEIASLQSERAYQTVANEVAVAYYQVLRAVSLRRIAQEAVRRAEDDLGVARKLEKGGVIEREKVLRVEVQLAQSQRQFVSAEGSLAVAIAAINVAMGVDVSAPTAVAEVDVMPAPPNSLSDCLQLAAAQRRELNVARCGVQVAQQGERVAKADFLPKIIAEGDYLDFDQTTPRANLGLGLGFIKLEWGLFEGGRRIGELHVADSKTRAAVALAQTIADTISFQTVEAYHQMVTALKGIDLAKPAVTQAQENYRLIKARAAQGDATATELTDAETALTRAEQDHLNSIYDYLTARARLDFAMGNSDVGQ